MNAFLAVVAFCVNNQCAFYTSKTIVESPEHCEKQGRQLEAELFHNFGPQVSMLVGCIKVPMKIASETGIGIRQG
jgi:hypothetical protein